MRQKLISQSKTCFFSFYPRIDTASIKRHFPSQHKITFEFIRSPPNFSLLCTDSTKRFYIEILDMTLSMRQITPHETISTKLHKLLSIKVVYLPITRLICRTRGLHAGKINIYFIYKLIYLSVNIFYIYKFRCFRWVNF